MQQDSNVPHSQEDFGRRVTKRCLVSETHSLLSSSSTVLKWGMWMMMMMTMIIIIIFLTFQNLFSWYIWTVQWGLFASHQPFELCSEVCLQVTSHLNCAVRSVCKSPAIWTVQWSLFASHQPFELCSEVCLQVTSHLNCAVRSVCKPPAISSSNRLHTQISPANSIEHRWATFSVAVVCSAGEEISVFKVTR